MVGGTVSSLLALLSGIKDRYDISIYSRSSLGKSRSLFADYAIIDETIWLSTTVRGRGIVIYWLSRLLQLLVRVLEKLKINVLPLLVKTGCKRIHINSFDVVIAYQESLVGFARYIPFENKYCWIHSDITRTGYNSGFESFKKIVCVSCFAKEQFLTVYPYLSDRVEVFYNQLDKRRIEEASNSIESLDEKYDTSQFTLVSVGRFDPIKQFDVIPSIASSLRMSIGDTFRWYIIGGDRYFNRYENSIKKEIEELDLSNIVILLGEKTNIYPYLKKADLLIIPSKSETFSLVAFEARLLGTPIIMNDIPVAYEIIKDNSGWIVGIDSMCHKIIEFYNNPFRVDSFINVSSSCEEEFLRLIG